MGALRVIALEAAAVSDRSKPERPRIRSGLTLLRVTPGILLILGLPRNLVVVGSKVQASYLPLIELLNRGYTRAQLAERIEGSWDTKAMRAAFNHLETAGVITSGDRPPHIECETFVERIAGQNRPDPILGEGRALLRKAWLLASDDVKYARSFNEWACFEIVRAPIESSAVDSKGRRVGQMNFPFNQTRVSVFTRPTADEATIVLEPFRNAVQLPDRIRYDRSIPAFAVNEPLLCAISAHGAWLASKGFAVAGSVAGSTDELFIPPASARFTALAEQVGTGLSDAFRTVCQYSVGTIDGVRRIAPTAGGKGSPKALYASVNANGECVIGCYRHLSHVFFPMWSHCMPKAEAAEYLILMADASDLALTYPLQATKLSEFDMGVAVDHALRTARTLGLKAEIVRNWAGPNIFNRIGAADNVTNSLNITIRVPHQSFKQRGSTLKMPLQSMENRRSHRSFASVTPDSGVVKQLERRLLSPDYDLAWWKNGAGILYRLTSLGTNGYAVTGISLGKTITRERLGVISSDIIQNAIRQPDLANAPLLYFVGRTAFSPHTKESRLNAGWLGSAVWIEATALGLVGTPFADVSLEDLEGLVDGDGLALCLGVPDGTQTGDDGVTRLG